MTGYTVHTGSSEEFASGWDRIFGDGKKQQKCARSKVPKPNPRPRPKNPRKNKGGIAPKGRGFAKSWNLDKVCGRSWPR